MKLEYLNKHHLMREIATGSGGAASPAERAHEHVKVAFPYRYVALSPGRSQLIGSRFLVNIPQLNTSQQSSKFSRFASRVAGYYTFG